MYQESNYLKTSENRIDLDSQEWEPAEESVEERPRYSGMPLLTIIQIVVCAIVVVAVLVFKMIGGEGYERFRNWYQTEVNQTVIATSDLTQYTHVLEWFGKDLTESTPTSSQTEETSSDAGTAQ